VAISAVDARTTPDQQTLPRHVGVLIIGAGLTRIGIHVTTMQPGKTFAIIEARDAVGGMWDLFRHTRIRSGAATHRAPIEDPVVTFTAARIDSLAVAI